MQFGGFTVEWSSCISGKYLIHFSRTLVNAVVGKILYCQTKPRAIYTCYVSYKEVGASHLD